MNIEHTDNKISSLVDVETITAADIKSEPITWLYKPYIPIGAVSLLIGEGGSGKSMLTLAIAAAISNGTLLPGMKSPFPASNILIQNTENPWSKVIKPRLEMLGADCTKIHSIKDDENPLSLIDDRIEAAIVKHSAKFIVLDPLQSFIPSSMSMNRAESIRPMFMHLERVAARTQSAVLLVGHLNKSRSKAQHRSLGSIDIINSVRSAMCLGRAEGLEHDVTAVAHLKANFIKCGKTQLYRLNEKDGFSWLGESDITPDDIMNFTGARNIYEEEPFEDRERSKMEEATDFLCDLLSDSGEIPAAEAAESADEAGISKRTLERARQAAGIKTKKIDGRWLWFI